MHGLFGVAGEGGGLECFDLRQRASAGFLDAATACGAPGESRAEGKEWEEKAGRGKGRGRGNVHIQAVCMCLCGGGAACVAAGQDRGEGRGRPTLTTPAMA